MNFNEDFSSSMPRWLRTYLLRASTEKKANAKDRYMSLGYDIGRFTQPRYRQYRHNPEDPITIRIEDALRNLNVDLSNATFVEVPVPDDPKDPIFYKKDVFNSVPEFSNKLFFYHLMWDNGDLERAGEQVWARGVNDAELLEDNYSKRLGSLPNSKNIFQSLTEDICYLDLADTSNFIKPEEIAARKQYKDYSNLQNLHKLNDQEVKNAIINAKFKPSSSVKVDGRTYSTDASGNINDLVLQLYKKVNYSLSKTRYVYKQMPVQLKKSNEACEGILSVLEELEKELSIGADRLAKRLDRKYLDNLRSALSHIDIVRQECDLALFFIYNLDKLEKGSARDYLDWFLNSQRSDYFYLGGWVPSGVTFANGLESIVKNYGDFSIGRYPVVTLTYLKKELEDAKMYSKGMTFRV